DIGDVRKRLESLGYVTCRVEQDSLVYCPPTELQPEAWLDVVALPPKWQEIGGPIVPRWQSEDMIARCMEWGTNEHRNVREYLHRAFSSQFDFPRDDFRVARLREQLAVEFDATGG